MAALKSDLLNFNDTPQYEDEGGGLHHNPDNNDLYDIKNDENDDDIDLCDIAPTTTKGQHQTPGHYVENTTHEIHHNEDIEPGATLQGEGDTSSSGEIETDPPSIIQQSDELDVVHVAISSLQKEIHNSEYERKQTELLIDKQFCDIINQIIDKKADIIHQMNVFYDQQKKQSLYRISELKLQLNQKQLEIQKEREEAIKKKEEELKQQQQLKREQEEKAIEENDPNLSGVKRLSIIGSKFLLNASKAKDKASAYFESLKSTKDTKTVAEIEYSKHEKIRLFMPQKELLKIITNDIKLSTEWWDTKHLNHIVFNTHDAELWRTSAIEECWYNAFGSIKIGKSQAKRWNIKICERIQQYEKATGKKEPAHVMVGIIESDKRQSQDKSYGFWQKGFDGFGYYGLNGKIFHKKTKGKAYGNPFYGGSVIGIELNMHISPEMELHRKRKSKMNVKNSNSVVRNHGGVVRFYIDGVCSGIAFYDLDLNKEYSLAVSLNSCVYSLQLID